MSPRLLWLIGGIIVFVLVILAVWFFYPRPIRTAAPMPESPQEKRQRMMEAMKKAMQKAPIAPTQPSAPR